MLKLYASPMKANALVKHNIDALLKAHGQTRKDLAQWCRRSESWISKIMRNPTKDLPMRYMDRIADFFGLATYQLFQPGISSVTERRRLEHRRSGRDRRIEDKATRLGLPNLKIAESVDSRKV